MKNYFYLFIAICALSVSSCKKDKTDENGENGGNGTLTATNYGFDGLGSSGKFTSTKVGITQTTVAGVTTFALSAIKDGTNESINIVVPRKIASTGKINFAYNEPNTLITISKDYTKPGDGTLNYKTSASNSTTKGGGELNITKLDGDKIEGTFYFIALNSNGKEAWAENGSFSGTIK